MGAQLDEQRHELERKQKENDKAQKEKQRQTRERRRREAEAASRIPTAVATMAYPQGVGQSPPPQVAQAYPSAPGGYVQYGGAPGYGQQPQYVGYGQQQQPPPYPYGYGAAEPPPNYGYGYGQPPPQRTVYVEERRRGMDPGMAMLGGFLVGDMLGGGF